MRIWTFGKTRFGRANVGIALTVLGICASARAAAVYNFDGLTASDPTTSSPALLGTTTVGAVGQDGWVCTSGAVNGAIVRNDARPGFSGNWGAGYLATTNGQYDTIMTRKNDANWSYSIGTDTQLTISANLLVGSTNNPGEINHRAEIALGYDTNGDGKIRPTSATADNSEIAFMVGFDSTGPGWYMRPAAFGTAVTSNANASGVWLAQAVVDLAANSGDGSGTLYVQQLYDAAGNPVVDTLHTVSASLTNMNLGIKRMSTVTGGSAAAANPANWNGLLARFSGNGAVDDITITSTPEPASATLCALAGLTLLRRRRV
jgi:hypothetical protein